MAAIPKQYAYLTTIGVLPRMVSEALKYLGTIETPGPGNTPLIMRMARETGCDRQGFYGDVVPWCGLFMAFVAKEAGKQPPKWPLGALNWGGFGEEAHQPCLGDVLVFTRKGGGHVGLYVGEDKSHFHVLGGNQGDSVSIRRIEKARLYRVRRPLMSVPPASMKPYFVAASGIVTTNEA